MVSLDVAKLSVLLSISGAPTVLPLLSEGESETLRNFVTRMLRSPQEVARMNDQIGEP